MILINMDDADGEAIHFDSKLHNLITQKRDAVLIIKLMVIHD